MKAIFGGSVKKPLMTKVSMRHLNEIVRERNQYSRDAMEAWQDFINLKGRMDTELSKVTKRNNFLVEELETWKQQVCFTLCVFLDRILRLTVPCSFSSSRLSQSSSPRKLLSLRSRLRTTSARIAVLLVSLTSRRMMWLASRFACPARRSSAMML